MAQSIGVEVKSGTRSGPTNTGAPAGIFQIAGLTERGRVGEAVQVRSFNQYRSLFGSRAPYAGHTFDTARMFFEEGGAELLVSRVVGPDARTASVELPSTEEGGGAGAPVVEIILDDPGAWGNTLSAEVASTSGGSHTLTIAEGDEVLALWRDVDTVADLVARSESSGFLTVQTLTESGDQLDLAAGEFEFTGGSDDRDNVTIDAVISALDASGPAGEGGAVAVPGYPADIIGGPLSEYAARSRKIALLAPDRDASVPEVEALAADLRASIQGDVAGLFYPHVRIPDASATRIVSPEGLIAGIRARTFRGGQFWQIPAGVERGRANWILGTSTPVNSELLERLSDVQVNGVQTRNGRIYLNNWASLTRDRETWKYLSNRDVLNNLKVQVQQALEPFVWSTIDGRGFLLSDITGAVTAIYSPIATQDGFFALVDADGEEIDPGYSITVDATNNPTSVAADNRIVVDTAVRLSPAAQLISVEIVKVSLGAAV